MWKEFQSLFKNIKNADKLQSFSIYHDLDYREEDVDIEICVVTDKWSIAENHANIICRQISQVDVAACFIVYGDYTNIGNAYKEFAYWLEQHKKYKMQGQNRQICHVSVCHTDNPKEYITELQVQLIVNTNERAEMLFFS